MVQPGSDDPFEAYKRKKQAEAEAKQAAEAAAARPREVREDGRPAGFSTHRHDLDKKPVEDAPPEPVERPKGFKQTKLTDEKAPEPTDVPGKPKGFKTHKLT